MSETLADLLREALYDAAQAVVDTAERDAEGLYVVRPVRMAILAAALRAATPTPPEIDVERLAEAMAHTPDLMRLYDRRTFEPETLDELAAAIAAAYRAKP